MVIVGAGQAGFQTAFSLREGGFRGPVTLIGNEKRLPYQRPPLSKAFLHGLADEASLHFRPQTLFEKLEIDFLPDAEVTAIDRASCAMVCGAGQTIPYEHAVIATGSRPRRLLVEGAGLGHVVYLRTIEDAIGLKEKVARANDIVVIGAGFIGLEFASVARKLGRNVHVVEAGSRMMARAVTPPAAAFVQRRHESWGVEFSFETTIEAIKSRDHVVTGVRLGDGRVLKADLVVVGIGAVANCELAAEAGLATDCGILVDDHLLTSDPRISAIGDCAVHPNVFARAPIRLESVQNAADQGRAVAARLLGEALPYRAVPWFWSDQGDVKLQIAGITTGHDHCVVRGSVEDGRFAVFCFANGRFLGVESINRPSDNMMARRVLALPQPPTLHDFEAFDFSLKAILDCPRDATPSDFLVSA
ncbi:oxidoreductase [Microvirga brassicacearum]|uniref:Oxidoreductase n=2 Tax=Microvirga brassicacearum TaxID=2580413 RepID=A0A5N3P6I7_9HYPH|nr:oxidoreductase [Microvirga brassicacearum]